MKCKDCGYITEVQRKFGCTYHCNLEPTHMDVTYHYKHGDDNILCPLVCESTRYPGVNYDKYR